MDIEAITTGIYDEFLGNADLVTALVGGMHDTKAPQDPDYPYCVFQFITGIPDPTFTSDGEDTQFQFSLFHRDGSPLDKTTINDALKKLTACYDDATLTLTGYTSIGVTRGVANFVPTEDDTQQYVVTYGILVEDT
jgi:hypothetical protein